MMKVRPTHLLHFAWYAEPGLFWESPENLRWLEASIFLLRSFRESGGKRVVMAGTCAEYDWSYGCCSERITPCHPATLYGVSKNALQEVLLTYSVEEKLSSAWGRIFFLYGPKEHPLRLVSSVITSLLQDEFAHCTHGNQLRDFMHVEDVASAFVALLDSTVEGSVNIASGHPVTLKKVVHEIQDCLGLYDKIKLGSLPVAADDPPILIGDTRRLHNEVGWSPDYNLREGILDTVRYWMEKNGK